ncbi:MAG TPA: hypothetical protein VFW13_08875, partial [Phenylobacterium sp.]|nr:hypothetical protein [Phenylobacterium sp.]
MISVRLLQPDDDFSPATPGAWNAEALRIDFALDTLFDAMAGGDAFVREVAKTVVLSSVSTDLEVVRYRQAVVADALRRPQVVRDLYVLATEAVAEARKIYLGTLSHYPIWVLKHGRELMGVLLPSLARLRKTTERNAKAFPSAGWSHFFTRMLEQLGGGYLEEAQQRVAESVLPGGFLLSAGFGAGAKPDGFIVHLAPQTTFGWWERLRTYIFGPRLPPFAFAIH